MEYVSDKGYITRQEAEKLIQAGSTKAFKILKELCTDGKLKIAGKGKQVKYLSII